MGKYAREPDNAAKSCKSRGSHLRVHFKVSILLQNSVELLVLFSVYLHMTVEHVVYNVFTVIQCDK